MTGILSLQHCQRLSRCSILLNPSTRRVLSGASGRHFTLLPRNRGYTTAGDSTPKRSSHSSWETGLKVTVGGMILALGVYYVSQWVLYIRNPHVPDQSPYLALKKCQKPVDGDLWTPVPSLNSRFVDFNFLLPGSIRRCLAYYHASRLPVCRTIKKTISCWIWTCHSPYHTSSIATRPTRCFSHIGRFKPRRRSWRLIIWQPCPFRSRKRWIPVRWYPWIYNKMGRDCGEWPQDNKCYGYSW